MVLTALMFMRIIRPRTIRQVGIFLLLRSKRCLIVIKLFLIQEIIIRIYIDKILFFDKKILNIGMPP